VKRQNITKALFKIAAQKTRLYKRRAASYHFSPANFLAINQKWDRHGKETLISFGTGNKTNVRRNGMQW